jgi:hypothetical protein
VGKGRNPAAIDDLVVDDFVLTTGGVDVASKVSGRTSSLRSSSSNGRQMLGCVTRNSFAFAMTVTRRK